MTKKEDAAQILESWIERDLTEAAAAGQLQPGFDVDDQVHEIGELLSAGRCPLITGDPGIGKTTLVHELVRRAHAGQGPACLQGRRVLQISFQRQASTLKNARELGSQLHKLVQVIAKLERKPLVFIRDIHVADALNFEDQLVAVGYAFENMLIGEGPIASVQAMLENEPSLEQHFFVLKLKQTLLGHFMVRGHIRTDSRRRKQRGLLGCRQG